MREIKFRGLIFKQDQGYVWRYGYLASEDLISSDSFYGVVRKETVGQYTGLNDKNGKEIYEGDVLKNKMGRFAVSWNSDRGSWTLNPGTGEPYPELNSGTRAYLELIGNIHENPHLLEAKP